MEKPKYNNEQVLLHCINREPHSLIFDEQFLNYNEQTVLELCEDLETCYNYLVKKFENAPKHIKEFADVIQGITIANSLVWAGLYHIHNDIVPEKYKTELP